jgi:hypothetical protein
MVFEFLEKADLDTVQAYVDGIKAQLDAKAQQLVTATNTLSGSIDSRIAAQQTLITQQQAIINAQAATIKQMSMFNARAGNYVPLYSWNANGYQQVIAQKVKYPWVPIIAAINPSSGPGTAKSATIETAVKAMQAVGIWVLEYIGTNYGSELTKREYPVGNPWPGDVPRDLASVKQECLNAVNWYGVDGFMGDDFSNKQFITLPDGTTKDVYTTFYQPLITYMRSLPGIKFIKGNMGTKPLYMPLADLCDNVCVLERDVSASGMPTAANIATATINGQLRNKATIVLYNASAIDAANMVTTIPQAKYYYISDGGYAAPPTYYDQTISVLSGL